MAANRRLQRALRGALAEAADPGKAGPMQAYMKSAMPFYGVPAVPMRAVCEAVFPQFPLSTQTEWRDTCKVLWDDAR